MALPPLPLQAAERSAKQEILAKVEAMAQDVSIRIASLAPAPAFQPGDHASAQKLLALLPNLQDALRRLVPCTRDANNGESAALALREHPGDQASVVMAEGVLRRYPCCGTQLREQRANDITRHRRKIENDGALGGKSFMELQDGITRLHKALVKGYECEAKSVNPNPTTL